MFGRKVMLALVFDKYCDPTLFTGSWIYNGLGVDDYLITTQLSTKQACSFLTSSARFGFVAGTALECLNEMRSTRSL